MQLAELLMLAQQERETRHLLTALFPPAEADEQHVRNLQRRQRNLQSSVKLSMSATGTCGEAELPRSLKAFAFYHNDHQAVVTLQADVAQRVSAALAQNDALVPSNPLLRRPLPAMRDALP
ncbi:MAG: hypothetical protein V2I45_10530 [Halieaceae bacterium]|nr:hypothetical protein [Halieaceae bacterium]